MLVRVGYDIYNLKKANYIRCVLNDEGEYREIVANYDDKELVIFEGDEDDCMRIIDKLACDLNVKCLEDE